MHIDIEKVTQPDSRKERKRDRIHISFENLTNNCSAALDLLDLHTITVDLSKIRPVKEITDADVNALTDEQMEQLFADYFAEKAEDVISGVGGATKYVVYIVGQGYCSMNSVEFFKVWLT